jgi:hypothetical protein
MIDQKVIERIFDSKLSFHKEQAKASIESKIRTLIELQKIALNIKGQSQKNPSDYRRVWEI